MSDEREKGSLEWLHPASQLMLMAVAVAIGEITWFGLRHFPWFADFEDRHNFWATFLCYWAIYPAMYLFRRKRRFADQRQFRADVRAGRLRRPSLALRGTVMLLALGLVVAAPLVENAWPLLIIGVPVLLVFAAEEVNIILRPGEMVRTDPHDELLAFFRQRTLQVGYSVAIASIATLFVVSQFASQYLRELLPVALVVSLLVPAFYYTRLDRQAAADE
jgi:hypothetical protein